MADTNYLYPARWGWINQEKFLEETLTSMKLSSSFSKSRSFIDNSNIFYKNLNGTFYICFEKIRMSSGINFNCGKETLQGLLKLKMELKKFFLNNTCLIGKEIAEKKLKQVEISKSAKIIKDQINEIQLEGKFAQNGFWNIKCKCKCIFASILSYFKNFFFN